MGILTSDIPKLKNQISKSLQDGNVDDVIDHMNALKEWKATTETLKSTRIGVFVTDLRKHSNATDELKQASKECVAKWKADIGKAASGTASTSKASSVKETSSAEVSSSSVVERSVKTDNISVGRGLQDKIRIKCTEVLYSALASGTDHEAKKVMAIAQDIEAAALSHFKSVSDQYKSKLRSLVSNLRDKNNPDLRTRVLSGKIPAATFALMTPEELMSKDRKAEIEEVQKQNLAEAITVKPVHNATDIFKCGKCKQRKTTYYQMQTRSADEPMTTFVTCLNCDNRWKFC